MPGKQVGMSDICYPDSLIGSIPNLYYYAANNPSEATIAKRRSYANTISYLTPPAENAGLYKGLKVSLLPHCLVQQLAEHVTFADECLVFLMLLVVLHQFPMNTGGRKLWYFEMSPLHEYMSQRLHMTEMRLPEWKVSTLKTDDKTDLTILRASLTRTS